jgi:hypothetical protein
MSRQKFKSKKHQVCSWPEKPNAITKMACAEADEMCRHPEHFKSFHSAEELFAELDRPARIKKERDFHRRKLNERIFYSKRNMDLLEKRTKDADHMNLTSHDLIELKEKRTKKQIRKDRNKKH